MPHPEWPVEGGCRCARVRFVVKAAPLMEMACHCTGCQKMTASAFSTTLIVPAQGFALTSGETVIGGVHGDDSTHHHCSWCHGWLYTTARIAPDSVNVRATLLDDAGWFEPWAETQTAEKLSWASTGARRSFERFPGMDEFAALAAQYRGERVDRAGGRK